MWTSIWNCDVPILQISRTYDDQCRGAIPSLFDYCGLTPPHDRCLRPTGIYHYWDSCHQLQLLFYNLVDSPLTLCSVNYNVQVVVPSRLDLKSVSGRQWNILVFSVCCSYTKTPLDITTQRFASCQLVHCNTAAEWKRYHSLNLSTFHMSWPDWKEQWVIFCKLICLIKPYDHLQKEWDRLNCWLSGIKISTEESVFNWSGIVKAPACAWTRNLFVCTLCFVISWKLFGGLASSCKKSLSSDSGLALPYLLLQKC